MWAMQRSQTYLQLLPNSAVTQIHSEWHSPKPCMLLPQGSKLQLHEGDAEEPDVSDLRLLPDTESLADRPKACLQVRRTA